MRKEIKGYEGLYEVDDKGNVYSLSKKTYNGKGYYISKEKIMKGSANQKGYLQVELRKNKVSKTFMIHRLVAIAFLINEKNKPQINHINGIKTDNRLSNLEWCTNSENQKHAYKLGLNVRSEKAGKPKIKVRALDKKNKQNC